MNGRRMNKREWEKRQRRSFLVAGAYALLAASGIGWIFTRKLENGLPWPLRSALKINEKLFSYTFNDKQVDRAASPAPGTAFRVNGSLGLDDDLPSDLLNSQWTIAVNQPAPPTSLAIRLDEILRSTMISTSAEFRCVEGWSQTVAYSGIRFGDFLKKIGCGTKSGIPWSENTPRSDLYSYVGFETPDSEYYVSVDIESMLHPQTILATEINGVPLTEEHGAPLRLIIPVKYGIKSLKRIGRVLFSDTRPRDYWAERGYDWYAGL